MAGMKERLGRLASPGTVLGLIALCVALSGSALAAALIDSADVKNQVATAAVQAVALASSAEKRLELSRRAIELSEKNIKAEVGRFELGKSTNFDVLLRQDELKQARLRYARAVADYLRARAALGALTGELLPEYGVKVK